MILFLKSYLISILLIIAFVNFSIQHVVPSSKNPGDAARDYCKTFGWKPAPESQHSNIKGVRNAEVGQFPMIAALYAVSTVDGLKESRYFCSGSLISDKFVVTGATCVTRKRYIDSYFVRLGRTSIDLANDNDTSLALDITFNLDDVSIHPNYTRHNRHDDIALISLGKAIKFTNHIKPICLDIDEQHQNTNRTLTFVGHGQIFDTSTTLNWIKYEEVKEYGYENCNQNFGKLFYDVEIRESQICVMAGKNVDTCQGYREGLLIDYAKEEKMTFLTGTNSPSRSTCGLTNFPTIYTRISSYIDWIESIVWPEQ